MSQTLYLVRGLPGSGKSTLAKLIRDGINRVADRPPCQHFEADQYFMTGGVYNFRPNSLPDAHWWCQKSTKDALGIGDSVVVSNTFTTEKEMRCYFEMAMSAKVPVVVLTASGPFLNVHNVPEDVLEKMRNRFDHSAGDRLLREFFPNGA